MVPHTTPQDAGDPLGIRLQMGRWIAGNYIAPPQLLPMKSAFLISPESTELACAATEIKFLLDTLKPSDQLTPVTIDGIDTGLAGTPRDLLHFVCHGKSGVLQTLKLNSPDELDCVTVLGLDGFLKAFQHRPMVFLNACEVGSGTASLDGVGGFANSFMQLGAAAVVAPLWAVQDKAALEVTKKFYPDALGGKPLAKIFQEIRRMSYTGDAPLDSYAAYCFYGDPLAVASVA
jgi:CHAT domain-containing protein